MTPYPLETVWTPYSDLFHNAMARKMLFAAHFPEIPK